MTPEERTPSGPRAVLRRVGGPLLAYHALILAGAYLVVLGYVDGTEGFEIAGSVLVAAGIGTELGVLGWSIRLTRRTASVGDESQRPGTEPPSPHPPVGSICVRCGDQASSRRRTCPRCGGPMVQLSGFGSEPGPPTSDRAR